MFYFIRLLVVITGFIASSLFADNAFRLATLPKAGTHLLVKCLYLLEAIPEVSESKFGGITLDQELQKQYGWHLKTQILDDIYRGDHKYLIAVRDIRDAILSIHTWMPYLYIKLDKPDLYEQTIQSFGGNFDLQLLSLIGESPNAFGNFLLERYRIASLLYQQRKTLPHVLFVKFEDLVGPNGGGSLERQIQTIREIVQFLEIPLISETKIEEIATELWGGTETFNVSSAKGQIGNWKKSYKPEHIQLVKERWNEYLLLFGYETKEEWGI